MDYNIPIAISLDNKQVRYVVCIIVEHEWLAGQLDGFGPGAVLVIQAHQFVQAICVGTP